MMEVQFFRGPRALYNVKAHGGGIYFAIDTSEILHNGISYLGNSLEEISAILTLANSNKEAIDILNGTGEGSIKAQIDASINEFATKISDDGVVNTFKELIDYAAANGGSIGNLIISVEEIKAKDEAQDAKITTLESNIELINEILTWKSVE